MVICYGSPTDPALSYFSHLRHGNSFREARWFLQSHIQNIMAPFCLALMNPISIKVAPDLPQCGIPVPYCIHGCSQTHRPNLTLRCLSHWISLSGHPPSSLIVSLYWTLKSTLKSHLHQGPSLIRAGEWGMLRAPDWRTLAEGPQSIWWAPCQSL